MWWLFAMQAAGMVVDWYATENQKEIGRMGTRLEQQGIENSIQMTRLEAEDASLQAMKELRKNLGTQAAIHAARGTASNAGSALTLRQESLSNFASDERTRRINLLGKEANLRAQNLMSGLHQLTYETQLGQQLRTKALNTIGTSSIWDRLNNDGPKKSSSTTSRSNNYGLSNFSG